MYKEIPKTREDKSKLYARFKISLQLGAPKILNSARQEQSRTTRARNQEDENHNESDHSCLSGLMCGLCDNIHAVQRIGDQRPTHSSPAGDTIRSTSQCHSEP